LTYRNNSISSPNTYTLNMTRVNMYEAEDNCVAQGGHLVSFQSLEEQVDVEAYFGSQGALIDVAESWR
jgi:hypothetical protein